jgi:hypothetical protein
MAGETEMPAGPQGSKAADTAPGYVLGSSDPERQRLIRQARIFAAEASWLLDQAGARPGWRAVDVGCGPGRTSCSGPTASATAAVRSPPEGTAGRSLIWRWADVNDWLTPLGLGDGAARPTRAEATLIDAMLLGQGTSHDGRARTRVPVVLNA